MIVLFYLSAVLVLSLSIKAWSEGGTGFISYQILKFISMIGYVFFLTYFALIDQTLSAWLSHIGWIVAIIWVIDFLLFSGSSSISSLIQMIVGSVALLVYIFILLFYPMTLADDKFEVVKAKQKTVELPQTNEENIVSVPKAYARYKAEKLVGELKNYSYYDLGVYTIQNINGRLFYITPVEFSEFSTWRRSGKVVPGYIKVDAMDENAPAEFVKSEMKYVPSAFFGDNLLRKVRKAYPDVLILEASFEPDDKGKPFYAATYGHYNNFRNVTEVDGIVLFDPENGSMKKYPNGKIPKFVDQLIPADDIASVYNSWFGKYENGWMNSWWGKKDIKVPTDWGFASQVSPVYDNKGDMSWFTDFTTLKEDASSMVGYSMIDAKTGEFIYYTGKNANGLINGDSAKRAVDKTFTKDKWVGTQPMLYNIYGEMTWFLPVIDGDGLLRNYALVNAKDPKILSTGDTKKKAFEGYKRILVSDMSAENFKPGQGIDMKKVSGTVISKEVVGKAEDVIIYIQVDSNKEKIYQMSMNKVPFAIVLEKGQKIEVEYIDTEETIVEIQNLHILNQQEKVQ